MGGWQISFALEWSSSMLVSDRIAGSGQSHWKKKSFEDNKYYARTDNIKVKGGITMSHDAAKKGSFGNKLLKKGTHLFK